MVHLLDGLALFGVAIATILMAIASLLGTMTLKQVVELGTVDARVLCALTGITDPHELQDVFGPPTLNRMWHNLSLSDIYRERRPAGHLVSSDLIDGVCIAVAVLALVWRHPIADLLVLLAALTQIAGWVIAARLPR